MYCVLITTNLTSKGEVEALAESIFLDTNVQFELTEMHGTYDIEAWMRPSTLRKVESRFVNEAISRYSVN